MRLFPLVLLLPALALASPAGSGFLDHPEARHARLLDAQLQSDVRLSDSPPLRLLDAERLANTALPPLDEGGAIRHGDRPIIALLLGLIVGFGTGYLVAGDRQGFVLFLLVDVAILASSIALAATVGHGFYALTGLGLLASHLYQGIDGYEEAGGGRIVEELRSRAVEIAQGPGSDAPVTTRSFAMSF